MQIIGPKNPCWKEDATYNSIHRWFHKHCPKTGQCFFCGKTGHRTEWALKKDKEYTRDINDYIELCKKCHCSYDNIGEKISKTQTGRPSYWRWKPIIVIDGDKETQYDCRSHVEKKLGINRSSINDCLNGRQKTAGKNKYRFREP